MPAAALSYGWLFDLDSRFQIWFKGDMKVQGNPLVALLDVAISGLGRVIALFQICRLSLRNIDCDP